MPIGDRLHQLKMEEIRLQDEMDDADRKAWNMQKHRQNAISRETWQIMDRAENYWRGKYEELHQELGVVRLEIYDLEHGRPGSRR